MAPRCGWIAGLVGLALATTPSRGQVPAAAVPVVPVVPVTAAAVPVAAAPAAGAAPRTLWGFFGITKANCQACKAKLCQSQIGQALNSLVAGPVGGISGGFIPPLCPIAPSAAAIAAMPGGPGGAEAVAGKIKQSEADAKARVAAVEYLGTVDCTHWPEATKALIAALREDPNECVRFAAARVLNSGCCCSKEVIAALKICVAGDDKDGAPPETSARVKAAAFGALQGCLLRVPEVLPVETVPVPVPPPIRDERGDVPRLEPLPAAPLRGDVPTTSTGPAGSPEALAAGYSTRREAPGYEERLRRTTFAETVDEAKRTLYEVAQTTPPPAGLPAGKRSLYHALVKARQDAERNQQAAAPAAPAAPAMPPLPPPMPPTTAAAAPARKDAGLIRSAFPFGPTAPRAPKPPKAPAAPARPGRKAAPGAASPSPSASTSKAKKGLIGLVFPSQDRAAGR